jgi:uncharacterized membrane protein
MTESHTRTIIRAICWRIVATAITATYTGLSGAIIINVWMTVAHYIHERAWLKITWGKTGSAQ